MKNNKIVSAVVTTIVIVLVIGGVMLYQYNKEEQKKNELKTNGTIKTEKQASSNEQRKVEEPKVEENKKNENINEIDYVKIAKEQLEAPKKGEQIVEIHVKDYGVIKLKLFKEEAPKAVENFVTHAKNGYYNGLTFHRVINEFMIQGGDPKGDGTGGESIWKEPFRKEVDLKRFPFRGTLAMASGRELYDDNGTPRFRETIGSQFFITQAKPNKNIERSLTLNNTPENILKAYREFGGYPSLFLQYTVFGQVYEGMEIVDKIAEVETDAKDKPKTDVIIEKIEIKDAE